MEKILRTNLKWNIKQMAVQMVHAEQVRGAAKSGYYKAAIILAGSVVEALSHQLLFKNQHLQMPLGELECVEHSPLPQLYTASTDFQLAICKRAKKIFILNKRTDFGKVIDVCLALNLFSLPFYKKIDKVRQLRNRIHIQGLTNLDRGYNKKQLESVGKVINRLVDLVGA